MGKLTLRILGPAAIASALWIGPADAQTLYTGVQAPSAGAVDSGAVLGSSAAAPGSSGRLQIQGAHGALASNRGGLAFTGSDVMGLVVLGTGAIAVGAVLSRRARRLS